MRMNRWHSTLRWAPARLAIAVGCAALAAAACNSGSNSSGSSASAGGGSAAPSTVHIEATLNLVSAPLWVALGPDYLGQVASKFHTKFVFTAGTSSNVQVANLLGGTDDFYTPVSSAILPPIAAGKNIMLINQLSANGTQLLIGAAKYESSRGDNVAAYASGKWCYAAPGSASQGALQAAATSAGLDWSKVNGVSLGSSSAFLPSMQSGKCDLSAEDATSAAQSVEKHIGYVVQNQTIESASNKVFGITSPLIGAVLATPQPAVQKYPDLTQAIDTALIKAELYLAYHASDPATIYSKMSTDYTSKNTEAQFASQWKLVSPSFAVGSGLFASPSISSTLNYLKSAGTLSSSGTDATPAFVNDYTIKAYSSLGLPPPNPDGSIPSSTVLSQHASDLGL